MIHRIFSDLPTFKELRFNPGLNLLVADRTPEATEQQTRNGSGKTSMVELVHFLLGGNADKNSVFRKDELVAHHFGMDFDLQGNRTVIRRSGQQPSRIFVDQAISEHWPIKPEQTIDQGWVISNESWKTVLGELTFGLPTMKEDGENSRYGPTFRSLISYFVRRQGRGGFIEAIRHDTEQRSYDYQVAVSFLLGLDWTISQRWQGVRDQETSLKALRKAVASGDKVVRQLLGKAAELRTQLIKAEDQLERLRGNINQFRLLPQYNAYERECTELTLQLRELSDNNTLDKQLITELELAISSETSPPTEDLERLYAEAGVVLPEIVKRRLEAVKRFHNSVISNRKAYLQSEMSAAKKRIAEREIERKQRDERRSEVMSILSSHGALDQLAQLQAELSRRQAEVEMLRQRFNAAEQFESGLVRLGVEKKQLEQELHLELQEQSETIRQAVTAFLQVSSELYQTPGNLIIDASPNGPVFDITIQGERSKGISNMQIFCFDMMMMKISTSRGVGPGFLIHDSHLFDGVDERQVSNALFVGAKLASETGFQYIVTMNSDMPIGNFDISKYLLDVTLTDATEDGGLFGFRFD